MSRPTRPVPAVGVVLLDGARVLLVQRKNPPMVGYWTVPGGKLELGETLEEAARRELAEETGLACTLGPVVEILERIVRDPDDAIAFHYVIVDFLGSAPTGTLQAGSDCLDARFVPVAELGAYALTDGLDAVIAHAERMRARGDSGPLRDVVRGRESA